MDYESALLKWDGAAIWEVPTEDLLESLDQIIDELKERRREENSK